MTDLLGKLEALEQLARAATPDEWVQDVDQDGDESGPSGWIPSRRVLATFRDEDGQPDADYLMEAANPADAAYIAAVDPPTVLTLVAELRAAREAYDALVKMHDDCFREWPGEASRDRSKFRKQLWRILARWSMSRDR